MIFSVFKKIGFWGILGPPSYGIGATIRIGWEMLFLPYAEFFTPISAYILTKFNMIQYTVKYTWMENKEGQPK